MGFGVTFLGLLVDDWPVECFFFLFFTGVVSGWLDDDVDKRVVEEVVVAVAEEAERRRGDEDGVVTLTFSRTLLFLGVFFSEFFKQMRLTTLTNNEVWLIYFLGIIGLYFMNWIQYSGRKRNIRRANLSKSKSEHRSIVILWLIPILCILLSIIFLKLV